ncbi:MAG TPA: VWA domain-containing protein [Bryobacteraceae bacterium]|jgi:VWFA-related protein
MKLLTLAGALSVFLQVVSAQPIDPGGNAGADAVIRVNVDLRQVDLIVTDSKGHHVSDLQPTDFQLLEDGKPQSITNFSWVEVTPPPSGARLAALKEKPSLLERYSGTPRFQKTPGNDVLASPVANLRKQEIRRMISIVAGDTSVAAMNRVRKFIDEQVGAGDMISIRSVLRMTTPIGNGDYVQVRDSAGIFEQFTNDKRQLDAATERLPRICTMEHICFPDPPTVLAEAIRSLQDLPGRKALLYVGRYRGPVDNLIALANRAGVVIYVLDTAGVVIEGATPSEALAQDPERFMAEKTGGRRILSTVGFDFTAGLNEVIEDLSGYYLLGYRPVSDDDPGKPPVRHKIEVKVLRPGLTVRVRNGLMGAPDPDVPAVTAPKGREEILTKTLFSAFTQDGVRVHLEPRFAASRPNPKKKRNPIVRAVLDIDGRDLVFADVDGGKKKTVLDVALAVFNEDGSQAGAANKGFTVTVSKQKAAEMAKSSLQYSLDVPLSRPGPYQVRAAVRDAASGEVGSTYAFLDIPDFNKSKMSFSSLVLTVPEGDLAGATARPSWNEFVPGATVQYVCEVFGLKTVGKPPMPENIATEMKLYRGGGPVADVPAVPVKIENIGDQAFLAGSLRIPEGLEAGNYSLEMLAYDGVDASAKKPAAKQWINVTVVRPAQ